MVGQGDNTKHINDFLSAKIMHDTDKAWSKWGVRDPYYAVLTSEEYRGVCLSDEKRNKFFQTGQQHFDHVLATIRAHLDPRFNPTSAVDFGCGTGRVLVAMSQTCDKVLGIDISDSMLSECLANCQAANVRNVTLKKSDDLLSALSGQYDLVHSFIVFQHIPRPRGEKMIPLLLKHLSHNGVAVLHFVYGWDANVCQRMAYFTRHHIPLAHTLANRLRGRHVNDPKMQMNIYDMNRLFRLISEAGGRRIHVELVRHGARRGVFFYFCNGKKPQSVEATASLIS